MSARKIRYQRPWLYPKQLQALFHEKRIGIVEATTKAGKTIGAMAWLVEQASQGRRGDHFWWVAPVSGQAYMAMARMMKSLPKALYTANRTRYTITLRNGAIISFKSADSPDSLFGEDVRAAVIDEAPRCKAEAWHAIRSTVTATGGPVRIIGNVKGRRNWAYQLARLAEAGEPDMHYARLTALDAIAAGVFDEAELESARRQLPDHVFRELYFAEPSDDQGNPFGLPAIAACTAPLSTDVPVVWGWDLAKSQDWCVGVALDARGDVCRFERFQRLWEETIVTIRELTGDVPTLIDSTGLGDPILERLQRGATGYFNGFKFSRPAKQQLMEGLAAAIHGGHVHYPDGPIVQELLVFEYCYTSTGVHYSAPAGFHDDCVCALALAVQAFSDYCGVPLRLVNTDPGTPEDEGARAKWHAERLEARVRAGGGAWFPGDGW